MAKDQNAEIWFSATLPADAQLSDLAAIPFPISEFTDDLTVIIMLIAHRDYIELKLLKDHNEKQTDRLQLRLDPGTLLIANRRV